jgi:amphiphysin
MEELQSTIAPELELIESRVSGPVKELQSILKVIRKSITKREHKVKLANHALNPLFLTSHLPKLVDYDRFNNSLTKLRDKKEKSLSDEKNLFKVLFHFVPLMSGLTNYWLVARARL